MNKQSKLFIYLVKNLSWLGCLCIINACTLRQFDLQLPETLPEPVKSTVTTSVKPEEDIAKPAEKGLEILPHLSKKLTETTAQRPLTLKLPTKDISVNVDAMPLNSFIHLALGEIMKLSFEVDASIANRQEPVTLHVTRPIKAELLLDMVEQALRAYDIFLAWSPQGLRVLPVSKASAAVPVVISDRAKMLLNHGRSMVIIPLRYTSPTEALGFVRHFLPTDINDVIINPRLNALVVIGMPDRIQAFQQAIDLVDVPSFAHKKVVLIRPVYWQAGELAKSLTKLLKAQDVPVSQNDAEPGIRLIVVEAINAIVIASAESSWLRLINQTIEQLDTAEAGGEETNSYVYFVKNTSAKGLGSVISEILGSRLTNPSDTKSTADSSAQIANPATATSATTDKKPSETSALMINNNVAAKGLKVVVDNERNALIFIGTARAYRTAYHLLQQLDREPRQILLEATVADITLEDTLNLGVDWVFSNQNSTSTTPNAVGSMLSLGGGGLVYAYNTANSVLTKINALANNGKARILSSPRLLTKDNEQASIQVGTQVAVVGSEISNVQAGGQATPNLLRSFTYVNTGIILTFTPTILDDGKVELKVTQEVSDAGASSTNTPPINTRKVQTVLIAESGQTIMIGGLIKSNETINDSKVPWLGDIPWLGHLFSNVKRTDNATNMVVLLTPHIVTSSAEASYLTKEFQKQLQWTTDSPPKSLLPASH